MGNRQDGLAPSLSELPHPSCGARSLATSGTCCRRWLFLRSEGLRYREIAEVLNMSPGAVSSFLARTVGRVAVRANGKVVSDDAQLSDQRLLFDVEGELALNAQKQVREHLRLLAKRKRGVRNSIGRLPTSPGPINAHLRRNCRPQREPEPYSKHNSPHFPWRRELDPPCRRTSCSALHL